MIKIGDKVKFTGHGTRRARILNYAELFGERELMVIDARYNCCDTLLVFDGIIGVYNSKLFEKV